MIIRDARPLDAGEVAEIAKRAGAAHWSREAYAEEAERSDSLFLVAEDGTTKAEVVGYAVARLVEEEAQLFDFASSSDGRGIGKALWKAVLVSARSRGAKKLTLEVSSANSRGLLFYKQAGAHVVGRRAKFYNDGSDAVLMDAVLS
ncbi:MAG TPA: GNAT family N-acetyltransferase [Elusimicrobiota bacterium]|nr:GNAT family N-acetyltransferase [Elusimicrobiota bacterium]